MKISGATFVRNAVKYDYPIVEAIRSILPICDEFIVNVGDSEDQTLDIVTSLSDSRLKVLTAEWDENLRTGGRILSQQTDMALRQCTGDWIFYIQADEVVHEKYLEGIAGLLGRLLAIEQVEGLLFDFKHFYGSYFLVKDQRGWYRREVRVVRNRIGISSWKDAQGFRLNGRKLRVIHSGAAVYHYGWARNPIAMALKQRNLDRYWHEDRWIDKRYEDGFRLEIKGVLPFEESHPKVMQDRIARATWDVYSDPHERAEIRRSVLRKTLAPLDSIGEYRNYILLKKEKLLGSRENQ